MRCRVSSSSGHPDQRVEFLAARWSVSGPLIRFRSVGPFRILVTFKPVNGQLARRDLSKTVFLINHNVTSGALLDPFAVA